MIDDLFVLVIVTVAFAASAGRTANIVPNTLVVSIFLAVLDVALPFRVTRVSWHYHLGTR